MKRIGVLLSGCGVKDGSEIHEATLILYFLDQRGVERICIAPDTAQTQVIDHRSGEAADEQRNVLVESARIARGQIRALSDVRADDLDGLILPGGFGAALNLCDYATKGRQMTVRPDVADLLLALHAHRKPIGAVCIAPVILAKVFGDQGTAVELTIGDDASVAADVEALGATHVIRLVDEAHVDRNNRIATAPAYMRGTNVAQIGPGIEHVVEAVVKMAPSTAAAPAVDREARCRWSEARRSPTCGAWRWRKPCWATRPRRRGRGAPPPDCCRRPRRRSGNVTSPAADRWPSGFPRRRMPACATRCGRARPSTSRCC